jgi:hypothetical protein
MAITFENGYQYIPGILSPQNNWGVGFGADGSMKIGSNPFAASAIEATPSGVLYRAFNKSPAATAAIKIIDTISIPANALGPGMGTRSLRITIFGKHAANTNVTTTNVYVGGTAGAIGDTNADGTALFTDIVSSASGVSIFGQSSLMRTGTSTQVSIGVGLTTVTWVATLCNNLTLTETGAIPIKLTQNCATTATDLPVNWIVELLF